jgi:dUTP pyrophosphatase
MKCKRGQNFFFAPKTDLEHNTKLRFRRYIWVFEGLFFCEVLFFDTFVRAFFLSKMLTVKIINTSWHALPAYQTPLSAGLDLCAYLPSGSLSLAPFERKLIPTGLFIELPAGYEAQVRPRSGLAIKHGISLINAVGTIDADYRGEICVPLVNLSQETFVIEDGMRIAQMVVAAHERVAWQAVESLSDTKRGQGGFGSTGG